MPYKILEDEATADVAFEATGKNLDELFESLCLVTNSIMADLDKIEHKTKKEISLKEKTVEKLVFNFIDEIIFLKDVEMLLFSKCKVKIKEGKDIYELKAELWGEKLDYKKHNLGVDVKAPTMHMFEVKKSNNEWKVHMILDI